MPDVTILIAAYNAEATIRSALDSALAQRGVDAEVLVVDDGSTDATADVVRDRARSDGRVRLVPLGQNQGQPGAKNAGFRQSRGACISLLDSDDLAHPDRTWAEVEALRRFPDAKLAFSHFWTFQDEGLRGFVQPDTINAGETAPPALRRLDDPLTARLRAGMTPGTCACTFRADYVRTKAMFDPGQPSFVDGEQYIRCFHNQPAVYCNLPLYYRRVRAGSISRDPVERVAMVCLAMDKARTHWHDYSAEQQRLLTAYERRCIVGGAKSMLLAGCPAQTRRILDAYGDRVPQGPARFWRWFSHHPGACALARLKSRLTPHPGRWVMRREVDAIDVAAAVGSNPSRPRKTGGAGQQPCTGGQHKVEQRR